MSLNGALQVGQSAILASQAAISVAGNNMANAATPGYHRQVANHIFYCIFIYLSKLGGDC